MQLPHELVEVDLRQGAHKRPEFIALNSFGQVPVLQDGDVTILGLERHPRLPQPPSTAIGQSIEWLPSDPARAAAVQRWLSVAAGQIAFGPARARLKTVFNAQIDADDAISRANTLLAVMDSELQHTPWLTGNAPTIADVSAYSYVAHAPEGNVSLQPYAYVRAWLTRIEALPGFVPMPTTVVGLQTAKAA